MDLRIAAYAVVLDDDGSMLLAHWNEGRRAAWTLPGGGMEPGEDPADTARREVLEETGYEVELDELLGIDSYVIAAEQRLDPGATTAMQALRIVYRAHVVGGTLQDEIGGTTDRAAWFAHAEVADLHRTQLVDTGRRLAGLV